MKNPERLAWSVLLISFAACVALAISVPLLARWWVNTAYVVLKVKTSVQQGTLQLTCGSEARPIAITDRLDDVCQGLERMTILTLSGDQGSFTLYTDDDPPRPLADIQVGSDTQLDIVQARAPRFSFSASPYILTVQVEGGRALVSAHGGGPRPIAIQIHTPEALISLGQGSVYVETSADQTWARAYAGQAVVIWKGKHVGVTLDKLQSVSVPPPDGVLQASRPAQNLIADGDLARLEPAWQVYSKDIEFPGEPGGEVILYPLDGAMATGLTRIGRGHAETGISQDIDCDVRDVRALHLRLVLRVVEQNVPVCGTRGTECPIIVKIEYEDVEGNLRSWLQGFYVSLDPNRANPPYCTTCSPRADHLRVEPDSWYAYHSPNLIPLFNQAGASPARIQSVTLYASGHTYRSAVSLIELLAQD